MASRKGKEIVVASGSGSKSKTCEATPPVQSMVSENVIAGSTSDAANTVTVEGSLPNKRARKPRRKTSDVWNHFTVVEVKSEVDGKIQIKKMAKCNHCNDLFTANSKMGTTHLGNHYKALHAKANQTVLNFRKVGEASALETWKYDEEISVRKYHLAIIMHEYPFNFCEHEYTNDFIKSLCPTFPLKCRNTTRKKIMDIFEEEKSKLFDLFSCLKCRVSCTMDVWTSNQNKGYLCVTCHFIDDNWKIQKRIIIFMHLEGRHSGANLSTAFVKNMVSWNIEQKLFALTLDNASANEVCVKTIASTLDEHDSLISHGKFFHVRCAAHVINLVARDGLKIVGQAIDNIRSTVMIVKSSPLQRELFMKQASDLGLDTTKGLSLDVATRRNSTYLMLADALYYSKAFQRLSLLHPEKYGHCTPSRDEWEKASALSKCLKSFFSVTKLLSGSSYPTANLFFVEFCEINLLLIEWIKGEDELLASMAKAMKEKFDKYWEMSNMALAIACCLDPRYKLKVVEFYYENMCDNGGIDEITDFNVLVKQLFDSYASQYNNSLNSAKKHSIGDCSGSVSRCLDTINEEPKRRKLDIFLKDISTDDVKKSELEKYWNEPLLKWPDCGHFDILAWWKTQGAKYPILSRMARDVLAIPVSSVASESAFSAGGRVIDKYRSRLEPAVVEALICTKDWINESRKGEADVASILSELEGLDIDEKFELDGDQ